ncbi:hypothetical protein N7450_010428 [Penicillium hetheringtonii]|uniref:Calcium channel YVC1-like C-terminal transmembrane domain-containing protein n=1 Tax=Penicillium hetheringtonii TaxID=911720 RepID=A0AAD6D7Y5_9EURO|nr:hypothetical protein N7450_010428 [Penicillium hetheringtonii]
MDHIEIPIIEMEESLFEVIPKLSSFISMAVGDMEYSFEQMRFGARGHRLRQLIHALAQDSHNPFIIVALMILKWNFSNVTDDDWGLNESRGAACEFVAWQFLCHLNQRETIEFLLEELPPPNRKPTNVTPLLSRSSISNAVFPGKQTGHAPQHGEGTANTQNNTTDPIDISPYTQFFGLNALEIAAIAHAKRFLSQRVVQRVVNDIWNGEIVFWDSLTVHSKKKPQNFNRETADPYSQRKEMSIGVFEALMDIWIAAFAYDELSGLVDAGVLFYQMDFWSLWNLGIIGVGFAFIIARAIGLTRGDNYILDLSFDILSLEALFLVPRICSLVSLNSYFGSLIPVLKEMVVPIPKLTSMFKADFTLRRKPSNTARSPTFKTFSDEWGWLRTGFLTTFTMLARDRLSLKEMSWMLVKVFFGSGALGLDSASEISPIFGYGLMLIFVSMTNILLLSSLISLMSMSLEGVMLHAREEYLFQLSIYVLESSNSRRLTYFMPPLNLIPLFCIRPMRLFLSAEAVRRVRIILLRATHLPFVILIWMYESTLRGILSQPATELPSISSSESGTLAFEPDVGNEPVRVDHQDRHKLHPVRPESTPTTQIMEMIASIERLRVQVERATANLEAQQGK